MPITVAEAQAVTLAFVRDYPGALELVYYFRDNAAELYGPQAAEAPAGMKGGYLSTERTYLGRTYRGRVDVSLQNVESAKDLLLTLRHEVLGHYGANTFTPAEKRALLDGMAAARNDPTLKPQWDNVNRRYAGQSLDVRAEEVFAQHCELIAPGQHQVADQVQQRGQRSFAETCIARVRPMRDDDLHNIVCMVAQGLRDRTRTQQNLPQFNRQFRRDENMEPKKPFHEVVAEKLIEQLKAGTAPWQQPWRPGEPSAYLPINHITGARYKGINAIHLMSQGRTDQRWMTYKQAAAVGAQVRKGEKSTPIQYWKFSEEQDKLDDHGRPVLDAEGKPVTQTVQLERPRMFVAAVFNAEQIDGLPALQPRRQQDWNPVDRAEHILRASGAVIKHGEQNRAFYSLRTDSIHLPDKEQFLSDDNYYATALHELGHWTGHESRLARDLVHPFGSEGYAREELRAEIASMILGDELGIGHESGQHVAYVASWIKALEDDPLEIFRAAADAEKIHDYVLAFEQKQVQEQGQGQAADLRPPHEMTLAEFMAQAMVEELTNPGRKWYVTLGDRDFTYFSDADSPQAALAEVHRGAVNNALYLNTPDGAGIGIKQTLPPPLVLAEYPDLVAAYPQATEQESTMQTHTVFADLSDGDRKRFNDYADRVLTNEVRGRASTDTLSLLRDDAVNAESGAYRLYARLDGRDLLLTAFPSKPSDAEVSRRMIEIYRYLLDNELTYRHLLDNELPPRTAPTIEQESTMQPRTAGAGLSESDRQRLNDYADLVLAAQARGTTLSDTLSHNLAETRLVGVVEIDGGLMIRADAINAEPDAYDLYAMPSSRNLLLTTFSTKPSDVEVSRRMIEIYQYLRDYEQAYNDKHLQQQRGAKSDQQQAAGTAAALAQPQDTYRAELAQLLALSTLTPGSYTPSDQVKAAAHAAVFVDKKPVILCGPSDDPASVAQAEALAANPQAQAAIRAAGIVGAVHSGTITGSNIQWQGTEAALVAKPSGQVEPGGEDGPLVAIVLNDPKQALATSLCVNTSTARIFDAGAPELDDGRKLPALARRESPAHGVKTFIDVPFAQKNDAKALGAKWARQEQSWYVPAGLDTAPFTKWTKAADAATVEAAKQAPATQVPPEGKKPAKERVYLAVPYGEHVAAKAAGAMWDKAAKSWFAGPKADMAKLDRWAADKVPSQQGPAMTPKEEFAEALRSLGCVVDANHPVMDGAKHRIAVEGDKKGERAGFYVCHLDGHPAGYIKNNKTGIDMTWKSKGYALTPEQKAQMQAEAAAKLQARAIDQARTQEQAAQRVGRQLADLLPVTTPTWYMQAKGIEPRAGAMTDREGRETYIPATDADGKLWAMQYIQEDGAKRFARGCRKEGCFHAVGGLDALAAAPALVIGEGYATASSLSQTLGFATVAAFDAGNLVHVAKALHHKFPDKPVIIAGDDDRHLEATQGVNPGRSKAELAAKAVGGTVLLPIFAPGEQAANPKGFTDFNDLATKSELGKDGLRRQVNSVVDSIVTKHPQIEKQQQRVERPRRTAKIG